MNEVWLEDGEWNEDLFEGWVKFWFFTMPQHKTWRAWRH